MTANLASPLTSAFTPYQKFVVAMLAFLQFTVVLDFMILSPLGALLMPALKLLPSQFGLVVSVYAFSAGTAGILAAGFADKFDRKKMLLFFYSGFLLGTFLCAIADSYYFLLGARLVTGLFGGVVGSTVFAITTDLFAPEMRGRVMGFVQTAFASSQIMGIPVGLYLANNWGWHTPFMAVVIVGTSVGLLIVWKLRPINAHLLLGQGRSPYQHLIQTLSNPRYLHAFGYIALLSTGGFMLMPFSSAFSVANMGIPMTQLPMVYMVTGLSSIICGPLLGQATDRFGRFQVFLFGSVLSFLMVFIYTTREITPLWLVILINVILFIGITSRIISSQAFMSTIPAPASRGSFMAISSSIQQISGGFAAALAGLIVSEGPGGRIEHFDTLGQIVAAAILITATMMYSLQRQVALETKKN